MERELFRDRATYYAEEKRAHLLNTGRAGAAEFREIVRWWWISACSRTAITGVACIRDHIESGGADGTYYRHLLEEDSGAAPIEP